MQGVELINPNSFKIRCSGIHSIMGRSGITEIQKAKVKELQGKAKLTDKQQAELSDLILKDKFKSLPQGAKTYCDNWIKEQIYDRRKEFKSKQASKGTTQEGRAIDFLNDALSWGFAEKNTEELSNGFITGTPDVRLPKKIVDTKCSWDCFTFPLFNEDIDYNYWCQGQGYMCLTSIPLYELIYVLMDAPDDLVQREAKYLYWDLYHLTEVPTAFVEEVRKSMTYSNLPNDARIKIYNFDYQESFVLEVVDRVKECRVYITERLEILKSLNNQIINF